MMDRDTTVELARQYASQGYLCSESVLKAIGDYLGVQSNLIPRIATGFGAGIGGCGSVCGALSGGVMALGLKYGRNDSQRVDGRRPYWFTKELYVRFKNEFGSAMCKELTGCDIEKDEGRKKYSDEKTWETKCRRCIAAVTSIVWEMITEDTPMTTNKPAN